MERKERPISFISLMITIGFVGAKFFYNDNAYNFQPVLKEALARYGLCSKLYTDYSEEKTMPNKHVKSSCFKNQNVLIFFVIISLMTT